MFCRIDRLESEVKSLTSSNDQLQIDTKRRQELVEQSNNALKMHLTDIEKLEEVSCCLICTTGSCCFQTNKDLINSSLNVYIQYDQPVFQKNSQMTMQLDAVKELLELCRRQNNSLSNQLQNLTSELESSKLVRIQAQALYCQQNFDDMIVYLKTW